MLTSIRRYWAMLPASIAGPAFIATGVLQAIGEILLFVRFSQGYEVNLAGNVAYVLGWLAYIGSYLALIAGLAAIYKQWVEGLDSFGKVGLLIAGIAAAVLTVSGADIVVNALIGLIVYGSTGGPVFDFQGFISGLLFQAGEAAHYVLWGGMGLFGIFVLRARANLLPGWTKALPFIIGLWGFLKYLISLHNILASMVIPGNIPLDKRFAWDAGIYTLQGLPQIILWVLLGMALLAKQPVLPVQTEPVVDPGEITVSS